MTTNPETPTNHGAYLTPKIDNLDISEAPYTPPGKDEVVIRNHAIAVNPVDKAFQMLGDFMFTWVKYPFIVGTDVAGEVVEVGQGVTGFGVGDRVVGMAAGTDKRSNRSAEGAFQEYTVLRTILTSPIPQSVSYEQASVLPLGLATAASGLFQKDYLALQHPIPGGKAKPTGETLLVWGGSTSVGSNAIQLAVASGYEVIATASPHNFDYIKKLGAAEAYDYRSRTVVRDIIKAFKNRKCAGAIAIGAGSNNPCIDIVGASVGRKFVAQASNGAIPHKRPEGLSLISMVFGFILASSSSWIRSKVKGVGIKFIWGSDLMANEVGPAIFADFLPPALAAGEFKCAPEPQVVGHGLEKLQEALDIIGKGVSAKKVVITL
jgi:NADPH:quinone reductase-like Zn-dependent oxidoreductase